MRHEELLKLNIEGSIEGKTKFRVYSTDNKKTKMQFIRRNEKESGWYRRMEDGCKLIYGLKLERRKKYVFKFISGGIKFLLLYFFFKNV